MSLHQQLYLQSEKHTHRWVSPPNLGPSQNMAEVTHSSQAIVSNFADLVELRTQPGIVLFQELTNSPGFPHVGTTNFRAPVTTTLVQWGQNSSLL